jgi:ATP-dependent helicase HrpB
LDPLPVDEALPGLIESLRTVGAAVLVAPPGAGKTTRVPGAILEAGLAGAGEIIVLEPRRIAARSAAARVAFERGCRLGDEVGYEVRFDRKVSRQTRIRFLTEGLFLRRALEDPLLEGISVVLFDEFHERNLDADLALALAARARRELRDDLRLVVMSATLDPGPAAAFLAAPVHVSQGRAFPVEVRHLERNPSPNTRTADLVQEGIDAALAQDDGDLLAFLPGVGDILDLERRYRGRPGVTVLTLFGEMAPEDQDRVFRPAPGRKLVLATNIAETSVTIPGIRVVIDSGLANVSRFDPARGLNGIEVQRISKASADQRAGRAGRTGPGICRRLWTAPDALRMPDATPPEIQRVDLAAAALGLRVQGETDLSTFPWFTPPPPAALEQADRLLVQLGALDDRGRPTELGRRMAGLPAHPRLARMMLAASDRSAVSVALAAALVAERSPFLTERDLGPTVSAESDIVERARSLLDWRRGGRDRSPFGRIHEGRADTVFRVRDQFVAALDGGRAGDMPLSPDAEVAIRRALLAGFPDRVVRRRGPGDERGVMVGGRGVRLERESKVRDPEFLIAVELALGTRESFVRLASGIEPDWLVGPNRVTLEHGFFDPASQRLSFVRRSVWLDLTLTEVAIPPPSDPAVAARLLAEAAATDLARALPLDDAEVNRFRQRVRCLREWMPELGLPSLEDADLAASLAEYALGKKSFDDLRRGDYLGFLQGRLTWPQREALDREAPDRFTLPAGNRVRIEYELGQRPVLGARIQDLFGMRETPRLAGGRVRMLLHLLAPNYRPQQVTDDLASFWSNTYQVVRKELRARYPKHQWPEDPLTATPGRKPKPQA